MRRFLHQCLDRTPLVGLLMAALLFRALVPAGFMLERADGMIVMELCSGFASKSVRVHLGTHADPASHDSSHADLFEHSPCGFVVAATAAGPPAVPRAVVPASRWTSLPELQVATRTPPSIYRSQTSRGPPLV